MRNRPGSLGLDPLIRDDRHKEGKWIGVDHGVRVVVHGEPRGTAAERLGELPPVSDQGVRDGALLQGWSRRKDRLGATLRARRLNGRSPALPTPEPRVDTPSAKVVFGDLDGEAVSTPLGVDLTTVVYDVETVVFGRNVCRVADHLLVQMPEKADEAAGARVVVCLHALDQYLTAELRNGVGALSAIDVPPAEAVPDLVRLARDGEPIRPTRLEVLGAIWPAEVERADLLNVGDGGCSQRRRIGHSGALA